MRRLSIRKRGPGSYDVGPVGHGPSVNVVAGNAREALKRGKAELRKREGEGRLDGIHAAALASFRNNDGINTRR